MKLHQKLILYFIAPIILAGLATETFASCMIVQQGPPCHEFWRADAVFVGVATRVVRGPQSDELVLGPSLRQTAHFSVEEAFRGVEGTVVVFESNDCPYVFKEGERYLVYAHQNSYSKKLDVRVGFTRTRLLSEAADDLAYIRSLPSAQAGSQIYGRVLRQGIKELKSEVQPLREVRVWLESNDERREVLTDNEGRYEFKGLSAGIYRFGADVPAHLTYREGTIKTTGRGCQVADIHALYRGQIAGRVLDLNGKPVSDISVTLMSADAKPEFNPANGKDNSPTMTSFTGHHGGYTFSQLMPGRYLLVVNHKDFRSSQSKVAHLLPTLFYPGVTDFGAAAVIVVEEEQKPQAFDFVLPFQQ